MTLLNLKEYKGKGTKYERKIEHDVNNLYQPVASDTQPFFQSAWGRWSLQHQSSYTVEYIRSKGDLKSWDSYQLRKLVRVLKDNIMLEYNIRYGRHEEKCIVDFIKPLRPWSDGSCELRVKALLLEAYMQELSKRELLHTDVEYATPCQIAAAVGHATDLESHLYCEDLYE